MQSDEDYIRRLMPAWVPFERVVSIVCGLWLMGWGAFILLGIKDDADELIFCGKGAWHDYLRVLKHFVRFFYRGASRPGKLRI